MEPPDLRLPVTLDALLQEGGVSPEPARATASGAGGRAARRSGRRGERV